jgi:hypothetical protein
MQPDEQIFHRSPNRWRIQISSTPRVPGSVAPAAGIRSCLFGGGSFTHGNGLHYPKFRAPFGTPHVFFTRIVARSSPQTWTDFTTHHWGAQ